MNPTILQEGPTVIDRAEYRRLRAEGMTPASAADRVRNPPPRFEPISDGAVTLTVDTAEGFTVVLAVAELRDPDVSHLGEFTDTWSPGVVVNGEPASGKLRYFLPADPISEHRRYLTATGCSRSVAHSTAVAHARRAMDAAREPDYYTATVTVYLNLVELAEESIHNSVDDAAPGPLIGQAVWTAHESGLIDRALTGARRALAELRHG